LQHVLNKPFTQQRGELESSHQQSLVISQWVICLLIGCMALGFNLYQLGAPSIWFDEALSIERARQSLPVLWKIIFTTQPNMALYYLVLHCWLNFTGLFGWLPTEFVVRFPSAIFAALSAVVIYLFGRRFIGQRAGLVSAGLYVINALQLTYAQETRSYSLQLLLVCCSWYALLTAQTGKRPQQWWACYIITTTLAVYAQLFSVFIILAQVITSCCLAILSTPWQRQIRDRYLALIASLAGVFIASLPILVASQHADKTGWLLAPQVSDIVHFLSAVASGNKIYLSVLILTCVSSVLSIFITRVGRCRKFVSAKAAHIQKSMGQHTSISSTIVMRWLDTERIESSIPVTLAMLCWFVIPLVVSYAISQGSMRLFSTRYLVIIVPPLLSLAALGIETLARQSVRTSLIVLLLVIATFSVPSYYQSAQVEDWKQATFWLQSQQQAHDGITCYDNAQGCQLDIEYYMRAYPHGLTFPADSPGSFPWVNNDLTNRIEADLTQAVDPNALAVYGARHPRLFFVIARLSSNKSIARAARARRWLDSHYQLVDQIVTRTVTIRLYQTTMARTVNGLRQP
jgi:uncharacterized membrane protein